MANKNPAPRIRQLVVAFVIIGAILLIIYLLNVYW